MRTQRRNADWDLLINGFFAVLRRGNRDFWDQLYRRICAVFVWFLSMMF